MDGIFDLLPDAVFCVDRGRMAFSEVNRAACECLGYTREELLGVGLEQICPPEDVAALARRLDDVAGDEPATAIIRTVQRRKDERTVPVEWHAARIYQSGAERWIIVARRLTERERGQAPFVRSILRAVPANGACPLILPRSPLAWGRRDTMR